jgi:hypothetical protein
MRANFDTPSDDHTGLPHDLAPGVGNQPQGLIAQLWELLGR